MRLSFLLLLIFSSFKLISQSEVSQLEWPREIVQGKYTITLYQPQLETLIENNLEGRMALSIKDDKEAMTFGALWFKVRLATDLETRVAVLEKMEIPAVKFPDVDDEANLEKLKQIIIENVESVQLKVSLDQIIASVDSVAMDHVVAEKLDNTPPNIYFRSESTVLVSIDGEPKLKEIEKSKLSEVINTPFFIVKKKNTYYMQGGANWFKSDSLQSNDWESTTFIPSDIRKYAKKKMDEVDTSPSKDEDIPKIIVSTTPSELVITNGEPAYQPITGTSLLFITNTESDIIMDINSQKHYLLLNGRWYSSKSLQDGDWSFIEPETLPKEFVDIPEDMTIASVRVSVPGTPEAQAALYENYLPQTAVVDRKTATVEVTFDGEPQFEAIEGTNISYALNSPQTVLKVNADFYIVDDGIWFISKEAKGPYIVSDTRPAEVDKIPSTSPVNNVKYVYIYDSTPDVVYVGYTPGYYGSYVYGGVVVYGTGYYYYPWYGVHYYPRPVTYGFGVHYNPYTGWGFSVGVSNGWMTVSFGRSYWGAAGYHHGYRHGYHNGYHNGYRRGYAAGYARGKYNGSNNIYKNRGNGVRNTGGVNRSQVQNRPSTRPATGKSNNMYADRNGNVNQRDKNGNWSQKSNKATTQNRSLNQSQKSNMNQQYNNRATGNANTRSFQNNRSSAQRSRSGGGRRGQ
jgi:hypothetical protein